VVAQFLAEDSAVNRSARYTTGDTRDRGISDDSVSQSHFAKFTIEIAMNALRFNDKTPAPPPNYQSRKVQIRLLGLVFALMLVIAMAIEARDPANFAWMWHLDGTTSTPPPITEESKVDRTPNSDPETKLREDFLTHVVTHISEEQRDTLLRRLDSQLDPTRDYGDRTEGDFLASPLVAVTESYFDNAFERLGPDDGPKWKPLLVDLQERWNAEVIQQVIENRRDLTNIGLLVALRSTLEDEILRLVKDNTMFERRESLAWRAMLRRAMQESENAEPIATTRLQLAEQPAGYRGRAISVGGRVLRGYTVEAKPNPFDIEKYNVLWIRPHGADHLPIAIYCLQLPAGFPPLEPLREGGNRIDEEIESTGWFYKHWAYASSTGLSLAPLLVARSVVWYPRTREVESQLNPMFIAVQVLLAVAFAAVFSRFVYRWSRWANVSRQQLAGESRIEELTPDDLGPGVSDGLRQMEREERGKQPE